MSDDNLDYVQEGFDPNSITVPRLRSLLVKHNINYPSTAKKPQLVQLFNENVASQASKIRARYAKAKRSSMGIVDAATYNEDEDEDEDENLNLRPQPTPRRSKSPRKASTRIKSEEPDAPVFRSYTRSSRSASRQLAQASDTDTVPDTASRSTRRTRRTVTPQVNVKSEEPEDDGFRHPQDDEDEDSFFSNDNPFQSGSSPPPSRPASSRRRTTGTDGAKRKKTPKRQTDVPVGTSDSEDAKYFEEPVKKSRRGKVVEAALEPGEEFTPEEQEELEQEWEEHGKSAIAPRPQAAPRRGMSLKTPFLVLFTSLLLAYGVWYRQEKLAVGYCGLGRPATQIIPPEVPVPDWVVPFVEPPCEPCPAHAYCYDNYQVRCESGFVYTPHPLSLGGLIPLPPTCEPDSAKARRVKQVADKTVEELREKRAQFECGGETTTQDGHVERVETPEVKVEELKETAKRKIKRLNKQDFDDLWDLALGEVKKRDEVEVKEKTDPGGVPNTYLSSTSLARLPLTCTIKRYVVGGMERHRFTIGAVIAVVLTTLYARYRYMEHRRIAAQVPALVNHVLDRLAKQKELGEDDIDDPWLFLPNLRDDVLRSYHSLSQRERYWTKVKEVVEQNSNVRTSQREGRNGEYGRAWEWIGPMDGDNAKRRKSGRVSWGADVKGDDTPDMSEPKASAYSKWEEPRPFY